MAGLTSGTSSNVVKTALDSVFYGEYDYPSAAGLARAGDSMVFKQMTTDRSAEIFELYKGPGYFQERLEQQDVPQANPRVGNQKTVTIKGYSKSIPITKWFFDDEQHRVVSETIAETGRAVRKTQDKDAADVYNLGFTTVLAADGVALFSNSHTALDGTTIDNLETGTLTDANMETVIVSLQEQKTQDGTLGLHEPAFLLVPSALLKESTIITQSSLRSGTSNNDLNYYSERYPGLQIRWSPFLGASQGGSDTQWFVGSRNHGVVRIVRQGVQTAMVGWEYSSSNAYTYKVEYREKCDAVNFEGIVGSNGTV